MEVNYTGALGKRTKFQQKEVAQLTLKVEISDDASENEWNTIACEHVPRDVHLDDEVRLNAISFSDNDITLFPTMSETHHAAVIGLFIHRLKSQPNDDIRTEQLMPHLTCLLSQPLVWSLRMASLYYRSKLESKHSRTVERALMQIQALVDAVKSPEPSGNQRLYMVHTSYLPPHWIIEAEMANMLVSLGAIQSALDIFLRLQLWEEVIACYNCLKLRHKAAEIIRRELEKEETVKMWCLLGDATDDIDCYQKAWELSGEKSGRVQRHWALYYYSRKQYAESIPHLIKSLEVNSLQVSLWFNLGYAALDSEDWQLCASAYKRYCSLEPDSFEAWNNLAKALLKLGNKPAAYSALHEAVKCNFNNWKVWDNLMAVSTDCANFEEVINCYHRILDLKEKHIDIEVLKILTTAISKDLSDCHDKPASRHRKKALVLFGRITAQVVNNATVWQLYAQTTASSKQDNESNTKIAQYLQKAHRAATQGNWERDENTCNEVIHLCKDLARAYQECRNQCKTPSEAANFMTSAKLSIKGVLTKIEKDQRDLITGELPESLKNNYKDLEQIYNVIVQEISTLQSS
uniref:Uncharacterized protein n=1 Tax=Clastoptera arizonana TaxID=38151 RepID=A0A1B6CM44_9HEMI